MMIRFAPTSDGGGSTSNNETQVELAELAVKIKEIHEELQELVLSFEKLRHRVETIEHQLANPE